MQILNTDERVVLADRCRGLVQEVFAGAGNVGVDPLNPGFFLLPVVAEFDFAAHAPLVTRQTLLVRPETVERGNEAAITQVAKRAMPTSMPMAVVATGNGCAISRSVWMLAYHLPPDWLMVMFLTAPRMSRLLR